MKRVLSLCAVMGLIVVPFSNSIVGGTTLVRTAINSEGFVAGSTGWKIERDGDAEFNNITVRGSYQSGVSGERITINDPTHPHDIAFYSGHADESAPALLHSTVSGDIIGTQLFSGAFTGNNSTASISVQVEDVPDTSLVELNAKLVSIFTGNTVLDIRADSGGESTLITSAGTWRLVSTENLFSGTWVDFGGTSPKAAFRIYPDGDIGLRGVVKSGGAATILVLPIGFRPPQGTGWEAPISGGRGRLIVQSNGNVDISGFPAGSATFTEITGRFSTLADGS